MSEYQYYEFRTINRQLTKTEQAVVNKLSSHGHTTATSFTVDYSWGNFKHRPDDVLAEHFDAFFYIANWGSVELKFCFPKEVIDLYALAPYCIDDEEFVIDTKVINDRVILSFGMHSEEGWGWVEGEGELSGLLELYSQILQGDYRVLYLAWLAGAERLYEYSDTSTEDTLEPPVPPKLDQLSPSLTAFVELFGPSQDLIAAAAAGNTAQQADAEPTLDVQSALENLSKAECVDLLQRLLAGETHLDVKLKQRLGMLPNINKHEPTGTRTIGELVAGQNAIRAGQIAAAEAEQAARHRAEMAALAARGDEPWQEVEALIAEKQTAAYRAAAKLVHKLGDLANDQGKAEQFQERVEFIRRQYSRRRALMRELRHL